jgi:hypothetical protein
MPNIRLNSKLTKKSRPTTGITGELTAAQIIKQRQKLVRNKAITTIIAKSQLEITNNDSENCNSLIKRMNCKSIYIHDETGIHGSRCEKRTCITCSNIKTMKRINKFRPIIEKWESIWFITLTLKNVKSKHLRNTLIQMNESFRKITKNDTIRRKNKYLIYIRSTEITVNEETNEYHAHIHMITPNEKYGNYILQQWLNINSTANIKGQDLRKADINTVTEIFKYIAKSYKQDPKLPHEKTITLKVNPYHLNVIDEATKGLKLTSEAGIKRFCKEINFDYKQHIENEKDYKSKPEYKENQIIPPGTWTWNEINNMYVKFTKEDKQENETLCNYIFTDTYKFRFTDNQNDIMKPENNKEPTEITEIKQNLIEKSFKERSIDFENAINIKSD